MTGEVSSPLGGMGTTFVLGAAWSWSSLQRHRSPGTLEHGDSAGGRHPIRVSTAPSGRAELGARARHGIPSPPDDQVPGDHHWVQTKTSTAADPPPPPRSPRRCLCRARQAVQSLRESWREGGLRDLDSWDGPRGVSLGMTGARVELSGS